MWFFKIFYDFKNFARNFLFQDSAQHKIIRKHIISGNFKAFQEILITLNYIPAKGNVCNNLDCQAKIIMHYLCINVILHSIYITKLLFHQSPAMLGTVTTQWLNSDGVVTVNNCLQYGDYNQLWLHLHCPVNVVSVSRRWMMQ